MKIKPYVIALLFLVFSTNIVFAQSSMTDDQILEFVMKENAKGTSQSQIVTKLMQRGVNINQMRRVREKYERVSKKQSLGQVSSSTVENNDRMRTGKNNRTQKSTKSNNFQVQDNSDQNANKTYDDDNPDFLLMQKELSDFAPDSIQQLKNKWEEDQKQKKNKQVFGRDIFNNKFLSFEPNMNIATPQNYRLGPGDAVFIDIYGASQKTDQATISPDGTVVIDGYGPIHISGLTVEQANTKLRKTLGARYSSSKVKLTVGETRTIMVNVMGEVKAPGTYTLSAFATVFHALYMAGGINDIGTLRNIKVYRTGKLVTTVDIYDYILNGKLTGNVRLSDNDVIVISPYDCLVDITGKVKRPMYYEMKKSESLGTLLKYAGGFTGDAYTKSVRLIRKTGREYSVYNVNEFELNTFHLNDADSVSVDSILSRFENMVEIKGEVFRPGMYQVGNNINSVRTLIEAAEGLKEEAFTERAVMHRLKEDRTLEVVSVDVDGILNSKSPDIPLRKNDVLFIPTKSEILQHQTVTIHGEVFYPGIYRYASNETLEDLILQAGGLKDAASTIKVDVSRRIVDPTATQVDSVLAKTYTFALQNGFVVDGRQGFTLQPFDEVYVRKSPGYNTQKNITIEGQVTFTGSYTLASKNERLSDAIKRAGGLTDMAYVKGARLERKITPEERMRMETLLKLAKQQSSSKDSINIDKLNIGETYFVGIELDKALKQPGGYEDLVLREGDRLIIPEYNNTVRISGNVLYPNTVTYDKGKRVSYYIEQAGGFATRAKKSHTYIIHMNGTVSRVGYNAKITPGCEIVVPSKPEHNGLKLAEWLSISSSTASIATMIATLFSILK